MLIREKMTPSLWIIFLKPISIAGSLPIAMKNPLDLLRSLEFATLHCCNCHWSTYSSSPSITGVKKRSTAMQFVLMRSPASLLFITGLCEHRAVHSRVLWAWDMMLAASHLPSLTSKSENASCEIVFFELIIFFALLFRRQRVTRPREQLEKEKLKLKSADIWWRTYGRITGIVLTIDFWSSVWDSITTLELIPLQVAYANDAGMQQGGYEFCQRYLKGLGSTCVRYLSPLSHKNALRRRKSSNKCPTRKEF